MKERQPAVGGVGRNRVVSSGREDAWLSTPGTEDDALPRRVAVVASKRPLGPHPLPLLPPPPTGEQLGFGKRLEKERVEGRWLGYIIWYGGEAKSMMLGRVFFKGAIVEETLLCQARHDVAGREASARPLWDLWMYTRAGMCHVFGNRHGIIFMVTFFFLHGFNGIFIFWNTIC